MKKETINKAVMGRHKSIQIFCNQQFRGYYIRGEICQFSDRFWDEEIEEEYAAVEYRFVTIALVNRAFQREMREQMNEARKEYGGVLWKYSLTEKEYLDAEKRLYSDRMRKRPKADRISGSFAKEMLEHHMRDRTLLIDLDEAGIQESEYLNESIKGRKSLILLNLDFVVYKIEMLSHQKKKRDYLNRIYTVPAFHCPERNEEPQDDFGTLFVNNFETGYFDYEYDYLQEGEYGKILSSIGDLGYEWIKKNTVSKRYLTRLNQLNGSSGDRTYPLTDLYWKFFDDLITQKQIKKCQFCGDYFKYNRSIPSKKFCSLRSESKGCNTSYHNADYYKRNKEVIKPKSRKNQREYRALLKQWDIKK